MIFGFVDLSIKQVAKPFVALPTDRRTKYLQNRCSFMKGICTKNRSDIFATKKRKADSLFHISLPYTFLRK